MCLEIWRPYFFMTDDNMDGGYPIFMEMGRHLLHGQSPFVSDYLFGGNYFLLGDPTFFCWHPLYMTVSLLAGTPFHLLILEVDAFFLMMLATAGIVNLAWYLRKEMELELTDGWLMFFCMSFCYSLIAITTGSSWLNFLGNQSAMPWLALGILQKSWRNSIALVALFSLHQLLGGHLAPTVSSSIFFSFFAAGVSIYQKSVRPLASWLIGYTLAALITLPLLLPMLHGFFSSMRSQGVPLYDMQANNIPALSFPTSVFLGMALWIIHTPDHPHTTYTMAMGSSAAVWCLLPALLSRARWRGLEVVTAGMMIFVAILIMRPVWISQVMLHLPLFRSMRWPFREMLQFQFFLHLFLILRPPGLALVTRRFTAIFSTCIMVIPMLLYILPPTFNSMNMDRQYLISGRFDQYWDRVRPLLQPGNRYAVFIPWKIYTDDRFEEPYSLLGTYNYATIAHVVNVWGYSPTAPADQHKIRTVPYYPFGAYLPNQREALLKEDPDLKFITLERLVPLRMTLSSRDGPTIELTPYIPPENGKR